MASEQCAHSKSCKGVAKMDFSRQENPDGQIYSGMVSVEVCENCGHVDMYALFQRALCDWLKIER
jgi:hypothetical protein